MAFKNLSKKGFSLAAFVIALLIFSGVIALLVLAVGSLSSDYGNPNVVSSDFSSKFDKFNNNTERTENIWNAISGEGGLSLVGTVEVLFSSTWAVIGLVLSSVGEAGNQLTGIGDYFDIPSQVIGIFMLLILGILMVIIVFAILNYIKGNQKL